MGNVEICGKMYKTVTIGNQTWLAKNLDVETETGSVKCYKESDGRLYNWKTAVEISKSIQGWHLPSRRDWNTLYKTVGSNASKLKAISVWSGDNSTDDYGFGSLPAGCYCGNFYDNVGTNAYFWSSVSYNHTLAYCKVFTAYLSLSMIEEINYMNNYFSVRLVKDKILAI